LHSLRKETLNPEFYTAFEFQVRGVPIWYMILECILRMQLALQVAILKQLAG
jgi:hypothetical protein